MAKKTTTIEPLLTTDDVMVWLSVARSAVTRLCKAGQFPNAIKLTDGPRSGWRIPKADVVAYIERQRAHPRTGGKQ